MWYNTGKVSKGTQCLVLFPPSLYDGLLKDCRLCICWLFGVSVTKCFSSLSKHMNTVSEILVFLFVKHPPPPPFLSGYSVVEAGGT